jgi:hypothetical protein
LIVPNCCAHQPVSACDWSRPVKNASSSGSAVDRMFRIAVDVADAAVLQMHADPAAARAHVASRRFDAVAGRLVEIEMGVRHGFGVACGSAHGNGCVNRRPAQA